MTASTSSVGRSIEPSALISPSLKEFATQYTFRDRTVRIYLHQQTGTVPVSGGVYGAQEIQTIAFDQSFKDFAKQFFEGLEAKLNLQFRFVDKADDANVRYYLDRQIDVGDPKGQFTVGITLTNQTPKADFWEIMLSASLIDDPAFKRFAFVHENGHMLGLEHPFDDSDGDVDLTNSPWSGAHVGETAMAYRSNTGVFDVTSFTDNDIKALQSIWGTKPIPRQTIVAPVASARQSTPVSMGTARTPTTTTPARKPTAATPARKPTAAIPARDSITGMTTSRRPSTSLPTPSRSSAPTRSSGTASQQPSRRSAPRTIARVTPASSRRLEAFLPAAPQPWTFAERQPSSPLSSPLSSPWFDAHPLTRQWMRIGGSVLGG